MRAALTARLGPLRSAGDPGCVDCAGGSEGPQAERRLNASRAVVAVLLIERRVIGSIRTDDNQTDILWEMNMRRHDPVAGFGELTYLVNRCHGTRFPSPI